MSIDYLNSVVLGMTQMRLVKKQCINKNFSLLNYQNTESEFYSPFYGQVSRASKLRNQYEETGDS